MLVTRLLDWGYDYFEPLTIGGLVIASIPLLFMIIMSIIFKIKGSTLTSTGDDRLANYTLGFDNESTNEWGRSKHKKISTLTIIILIILSIIIVFTPFGELVSPVYGFFK